jgi:hypothetical protein
MKKPPSTVVRTATAAAAVAAATVVFAAVVAPAHAGTAATGWRLSYSHHYGKASNYSGYTNVAVVGKGDAWALGTSDDVGAPAPGTPVAVHWNGKGWTAKPMPAGVTGTIDGYSVISAKDIWAVTDGGGYIVHWNGSKWLLAKHLPGGTADNPLLLTGITAINDRDVWAFGSSGEGPGYGTWHYDGHQWKPYFTLDAGVAGATATSPSNIWGVGTGELGPDQQVDHYNGHVWQDATPASLAAAAKNFQLAFSGAWAASAKSTWVTAWTGQVGTSGARLWDVVSGTWKTERLPWTANHLTQPMPDGTGGFWVGATSEATTWIWHHAADGKWSRIARVPDSTTPLNLIYEFAPVPKTTSLWAVGSAYAKTQADSSAVVWAYGTQH